MVCTTENFETRLLLTPMIIPQATFLPGLFALSRWRVKPGAC